MRGFASPQLVTLAPASKGDGSMSRRGFDARVLFEFSPSDEWRGDGQRTCLYVHIRASHHRHMTFTRTTRGLPFERNGGDRSM